MIFAFGEIKVQFLGSDRLIGFCRRNWQKFLISSENTDTDLVLDFEERPILSDNLAADGWDMMICAGERMNVYSRNRKPLFALRQNPCSKNVKIYVANEFNNAVRLGAQFGIMAAMYQKYVGFHGVTLLCGNEIIILSAPSGTGKTTLAKLLEEYCDAVVINGDFALLNPTEDGVFFVPTPFCGSSQRCLNQQLRVDRIVFLGQALENVWHKLESREALKQFMGNAFIPYWDNQMRQTVQGNILNCIMALKVSEYKFAPTHEAAESFLKYMEMDSSLR